MEEKPQTEVAGQQSIVVVDDNPDNLRSLTVILEKRGYKVRPASIADSALTAICKEPPDLILLDIMTPAMGGYEVCRRLKSEEQTKDIPVIFLNAMNESFDKVKAFKVGAVDFISKPFQAEEVIARVNTHLTIRCQQMALAMKNEELMQKNILIAEQTRKLALMATRDFLTGLPNRMAFMDRVKEEEKRFNRTGRSFTLIMLGIDHFKKVNDTYGHKCGEMVLIDVARILEPLLRTQDVISRWSGGAFICLLPETEIDGARQAAEKIRTTLDGNHYQCGDVSVAVTVTLGVSRYDGRCSTEECISRVEDALDKGKKKGRNQVVVG